MPLCRCSSSSASSDPLVGDVFHKMSNKSLSDIRLEAIAIQQLIICCASIHTLGRTYGLRYWTYEYLTTMSMLFGLPYFDLPLFVDACLHHLKYLPIPFWCQVSLNVFGVARPPWPPVASQSRPPVTAHGWKSGCCNDHVALKGWLGRGT